MNKLFFSSILFLAIYNGYGQTPANDPTHWGNPIWDDNFSNSTMIKSGNTINKVSPSQICWNIQDNYDHGGEPQVYRSANATLHSTAPAGLRLRAENQNYVCTTCVNGGSFYSTNSGDSWTTGNSGLSNLYINAYVVSGANLYAGTSGSGVFKSTNNGVSWTASNTNITNLNIKCFIVSGSNLYAGTNGGGIFKSTDNGATWALVNTGLTNSFVHTLAKDGSGYLYAGTSGGGIFKSTNGGTSWAAVNSGINNLFVNTIAINNSGHLFAGTVGGIFKSTNSGSSWTATNNGLEDLYINSIVINSSGNLFAGSNSKGVFISTNSGSNWTKANGSGSLALTNLNVQALVLNSSGHLFVGTYGGGVFRSQDNGASYYSKNPNSNATNVHALLVNGSYLYAGATHGTSFTDHHYVSGGISSYGSSRMIQYGYVEAKITLSNTFGLWPAFWLWNCTSNCADYDEVDIFEMIPGKNVGEWCSQYYNRMGDKTLFSSGVINSQPFPTPLPPCHPNNLGEINSCPDYTVSRTYGLEWSPTKLIFYIDGVAVRNTPNPGYDPISNPGGDISQQLNIIFGQQISNYVNWNAEGPNFYDAKYNDRWDYKGYFDTSYPYNPYGASVNNATTYSSAPINGPVNLNTAPNDMVVEYVKYWKLQLNGTCATIANQTLTSSTLNYPLVDRSYTSSGTINLPSSKTYRATEYILLNEGFSTLNSSGVNQELYLDVNPCY